MNKLKEFFTQNKALVTITTSVTMAVFLVFTVVAVAISGNGSGPNRKGEASATEQETTNKFADGSTETQSPTVPQYSSEDETCGDENESTEEKTTEPPVDPGTLPYMIMVNRAANCITVYGKDESGAFTVPVKAITVSCGKNLGDTPLGSYQTINEYKWRKMVDGTYSQYAYRIVGSILFHSVPYFSQAKDDLEWEEFNKLGTAASLGCVRMTVADSKWLMDHCPIGTLVKIYDDAANPGPLGKPDTIKIPADSPYKNWDPTDPDPANPWNLFSASITHPSTLALTIEPGTTMEYIKTTYFSAKDTCGNDISDKILVSGSYDFNVAGTYNLTFYVIDAIGSKAQVDIEVTVKGEETSSSEPTTEQDTTPTETTPSESESDSTGESESNSSSNGENESDSSQETTPGETDSSENTSTGESSSNEGETGESESPEESTTPNRRN